MNTTAAPPQHAAAAAALAELLRAVHANPSAFDFYALLRRIDSLRRDLPRIGEAPRPRQEALRLAQAAELDFAPAPLHALQWREGPAVPRLVVRFFGLLGPMGPLPLHFTEIVRNPSIALPVRSTAEQPEPALLRHDTTLAHFLDLFHHRTLSLFYRAWAQSQPVVHLDRPREDRFIAWLAALAGIPPAAGALPPHALAYQAGWLTSRSRHAEMLAKVIGQFFGVSARIEEHVEQWLPIERGERSALGYARNPSAEQPLSPIGGSPHRGRRTHAERGETPPALLHQSANAGSRVWDRQYRFRLRIGPITRAQTMAFLPGGEAWPRLLHWVRLIVGRELQWELQLDLAPAEYPLPRPGRGPDSPRLGLTTRLVRVEQLRPGEAFRLAPSALAAPKRALRLRPHTSFLAQQAHRAGVNHDA